MAWREIQLLVALRVMCCCQENAGNGLVFEVVFVVQGEADIRLVPDSFMEQSHLSLLGLRTL